MTNRIDTSITMMALSLLDDKLARDHKDPLRLIVGGASALVGAYQYPDSTMDIDAILQGAELTDIEKQIHEVGKELKLGADWLNSHYSAYTIYIPSDFKTRLKRFFSGKKLVADALGAEELLIMKFMAGRAKDQSHIRFLLKQKNVNLKIVEARLEELLKLYPKVAEKSIELFDELTGGEE